MTSNNGDYYLPPDHQPRGGPEGLPPGFPGSPQHSPAAPTSGSPWPWIVGVTAAVLIVVVIVSFVVAGQ